MTSIYDNSSDPQNLSLYVEEISPSKEEIGSSRRPGCTRCTAGRLRGPLKGTPCATGENSQGDGGKRLERDNGARRLCRTSCGTRGAGAMLKFVHASCQRYGFLPAPSTYAIPSVARLDLHFLSLLPLHAQLAIFWLIRWRISFAYTYTMGLCLSRTRFIILCCGLILSA